MFDHLFDMSDVERIAISDDNDIVETTLEPNDLIADAMNKIMKLMVGSNLIPIEVFPFVPDVERVDGAVSEEFSRSDNSEYLITDTFVADINRDVAFYMDDDKTREKRDDSGIVMYQPAVVEEIEEVNCL